MYWQRLKVWQVFVVGAAWIVLGIVLHVAIDWPSGTSEYSSGGWTYVRVSRFWSIANTLKLWFTIPFLIGLRHIWFGWQALDKHREEQSEIAKEAEPDPPARRERPLTEPVLPPPPNVETDPFRAPPQPRPIVVVRHESQPAPTPIVPGDPDDKPKLLT